jgi:hypothetical protein
MSKKANNSTTEKRKIVLEEIKALLRFTLFDSINSNNIY